VHLVLAAPGKQLDFSTPQGRIIAQLSAIFDEWYAIDISQRSKDSITHRKRKGITVGRPPFGTRRDKSNGFLIPSEEGAWYMPDGTYQKGLPNKAPDPAAQWRSYYAAAEHVLTVYAEGNLGQDMVAFQMQIEGWPFRDAKGNPVPMETDDVRRIVANWPEYGGYVTEKRARERHPHDYPVDKILLNPERAVFGLELLYEVGRVRARRAHERFTHDGTKQSDHPYPLNSITYCYHCEQLAEKHNNPSLRSRFGGKGGVGFKARYRHKHGVLCGCTNRSVKREVYEADFARLLKLLTVRTDEIDFMTELGIHAEKARQTKTSIDTDPEAEKLAAIAKCRHRIDAARNLYEDGDLSREEYLRRKEQNEREIAHWEARTTETEKIALELALCVEAVDKINQLWEIGDDENKQGMARNLFSYIVYDLDIQRIVNFRLKPWADRFITLRAALYDDFEGKENLLSTVQEEGKGMTLTGLRVVILSTTRMNNWQNHSSCSSSILTIYRKYSRMTKEMCVFENAMPKVKQLANWHTSTNCRRKGSFKSYKSCHRQNLTDSPNIHWG